MQGLADPSVSFFLAHCVRIEEFPESVWSSGCELVLRVLAPSEHSYYCIDEKREKEKRRETERERTRTNRLTHSSHPPRFTYSLLAHPGSLVLLGFVTRSHLLADAFTGATPPIPCVRPASSLAFSETEDAGI